VTASDNGKQAKPFVDQALDLFVYAPVGLLVSSLEDLRPDDLDQLAATGRGRIGRLLGNARVVGHLTIAMGQRAFESEVRRWTSAPVDDEVAEEPGELRMVELAPAPSPPAPQRRGEANTELAIPEYEALSASQVVRRLDGLGPVELEAVYDHELATRRRRTILHRTQQLLGREDAPGHTGWPA
jgi:hypothetical protein